MTERGCCIIVAEVADDGKLAATSAELVTLARVLGQKTGRPTAAVVAGAAVGDAAGQLASMGIDRVVAVESGTLERYVPASYVAAVRSALDSQEADGVLMSNSAVGQDLAPRLAFELGAGLVTDCVGIDVEEGHLVCTRPVYGGNVMASCVSQRDLLVATVRQHTFEAAAGAGENGEVAALAPELPTSDDYVVGERVVEESDDVSLEDADVVIAGGRGIGGGEGFEGLARLARLLGGAVGASRPPVDSGWIHTTAQVGITGKIVAPDVYIAVGLSGSSQHLTGMSDSRTVVAINSDPDAYIFKVSDYGVAGDWRRVLPSFEAKLKELIVKEEA